MSELKLLALIAVAIFPLTFAVGGAQQYVEDIKAFTMKHGAPPHPLHHTWPQVRIPVVASGNLLRPPAVA